tara:strand:+ start:864 stop:1172 length:309 start_codon:yes stop_codon:yes gene_type:complete
MWKNILKKPITIGSTKIRLDSMPDDNDECCETARKEWIDYLIHGLNSNSLSIDNMVHDIKILGCEVLYNFLEFITKEGQIIGGIGEKEAQEILDNWNKCEGK